MTTPNDPLQPPPPPYGQQPAGPTPPPAYGSPSYGTPPPQYGQAATYGGPAYGAQLRNGMGVAALVLGLVSIPTGIFILGGALGVLAIIFGFVGRGRVKRGEANNGGVALAGIITGALGVLIALVIVGVGVAVYNSPKAKHLRACDKAAVTQADKDRCADQFGKSIFGSN